MMRAPGASESLDAALVWRELRGPLLAFIARRTPDRDVAEDVLQDVLLRVHRHAGNLERSPAARAWVFQIARNAIVELDRRNGVIAYTPRRPPCACGPA